MNRSLFINLLYTNAIALTLLISCAAVSSAANDTDLDNNFRQLEDIRLAEPQRFIEGIKALESYKSAFTPQQARYFALLKGYEQVMLGNYSQALVEMDALLTQQNDDIYVFRAHNLALNLHLLSKQYLNAFIELDYINQHLASVIEPAAKVQAVGNISMLYNEIGRYDIALNYAEYFLHAGNPDVKAECRTQAHRINSLFYMNSADDFMAEVDAAIQTCREAQEVIPKLIIEQIKLREYQRSNDDLSAIALYKQLQNDILQSGYPLLIAGFNTYVAKSYLSGNQLVLAEEHANRALKAIANMDISLVHVELYTVLAEIAKRQSRYEQAVRHFQQLLTIQQQYADVKMRQQLAYHQAQGELEIKNQRIALLNKDNAMLSLQKEVFEEEVKQTRMLMTGVLLLLGITFAMAVKGITGWRRFKQIAEFDNLTGVANRYHFNKYAQLALDYCVENKLPAALILFDLDRFKSINDNYGHAAGDWALRAVVAACRNFIRNDDIFGRIGGEEFAVLLPGCQTEKAALLAEICRDAIAAIDTAESGTAFPLTASFGVSGSDSSGYQLKQLLADADKAMYRAKDAGRDQVVSFAET